MWSGTLVKRRKTYQTALVVSVRFKDDCSKMTDIEIDPTLKVESVLPLKILVVTLEAVSQSSPGFFHQPALTAFLRFLAGSPDNYDLYIRIDSPESGRTNYSAGDYYRFTLIGLRGSEAILESILRGLSRLPDSAPKQGQKLPFRNNWRLLDVQDALTATSIQQIHELSEYGEQQLREEIQLWRNQQSAQWRWLTPARLLLEKNARKGLKNEARYCRNGSDLPAELLLSRLQDSTADLLRRRQEPTTSRVPSPPITVSNTHLFWMDSHYTDPNGKTSEMGGITGKLDLNIPARLSAAWWKLLIIGQYLGIGQRSTFGWGRYQLVTAEGSVSYRRAYPALSLLSWASREENLVAAWKHVMSGSSVPWYDDNFFDPDEDDEDQLDDPPQAPIDRLQRDFTKLLKQAYKFPKLRGELMAKKNGGVRALAIPPTYDRVLQRALSQVLTPALEKLMYRHSHGYRPGRSRITASYDIQAAWQDGYRWVYESDIKSFFDSVSRDRLRDRLVAVYGDDPMIDAILGWLSAPVRFRGETIERKNGLPQGSPLSPLMANLMLDDFDSDMEKAGFKMIRYADDFVVLCNDPEQAKAAGEAALQSLQEHGLELHPGKTRITAMDDGFKYLGYLFVNDLVLDISGNKDENRGNKITAAPNSWLSQLGETEPNRLKKQDALIKLAQQISKGGSISIGERNQDGTLLTITGNPAVIATLNKNIRVLRDDKLLYNLPWNNLQAVMVFGYHQITTQAMHAAMHHNVPIHLSKGSGTYQGIISSNKANDGHQLWLQQLLASQDQEKALYCAREVVGARLKHMKETLRQKKFLRDTPQLSRAITKSGQAATLESLRGLEGNATREYFHCLGRLLPAQFEFNGRNRRPPRDPFNVLLSMGYTVVYGYSESILHTIGLLPRQGFYHQPRGQHAALASDMMEPFRHLVERSALTIVLRHEIKLEDFSYTPAGACRIEAKARRKYLSLLLSRWELSVRARGQENAEKYFTHMHQQALSLKAFIRSGEPFKAWRIR